MKLNFLSSISLFGLSSCLSMSSDGRARLESDISVRECVGEAAIDAVTLPLLIPSAIAMRTSEAFTR